MLSLYPTTGIVKGILYDTFITDYSPLKSRKKPDHNQEKKIVPVYEKNSSETVFREEKLDVDIFI